MKTRKIFLAIIILFTSLSISAQYATLKDNTFEGIQTINRELRANANTVLGEERTHTVGWKSRLYFGHYFENDCVLWMARYNVASKSKTDLRLNIGASTSGNNRFVIGNERSSKWYSWLTVVDNGRVGIGVETPSYTLDVNGTMRAKEVRVESGWADFVFDADYTLPSLSEVKAHIEEHKHLPGIPSEAEVVENGIGLAEITTKMMQKIEELTLYVIQQNEKIELLEAQIRQFNN